MGASVRRIAAMVLRYWYLLRGSWPRILELAYWPTVQMIMWGFISQFMATNSTWVAQAAGVLIAAVLLWDVLFRGQLGVSVSFLEEMWSRNLGHLFVSPLRPGEWVAGADDHEPDPHRHRNGAGGPAGDPDIRLLDLRHGSAAGGLLRQPDRHGLVAGPADHRLDPAPRLRRRKPRLGSGLPAGCRSAPSITPYPSCPAGSRW